MITPTAYQEYTTPQGCRVRSRFEYNPETDAMIERVILDCPGLGILRDSSVIEVRRGRYESNWTF